MRPIVLLLFLFATSCGLTADRVTERVDRISVGIDAFQGLLTQVSGIAKVTAELSGASKSTADRIDAIGVKVGEVAAVTKDSLAAFKASIESAPRKPDGTVDWNAWGTAGVAALAAIGAYLESLRRKAAVAAANHDANYDAIKEQEKQVAALFSAVEAKIGPLPASAKTS